MRTIINWDLKLYIYTHINDALHSPYYRANFVWDKTNIENNYGIPFLEIRRRKISSRRNESDSL